MTFNGLSAVTTELRKAHNTLARYGDASATQMLTAFCELQMTPALKKEWVLHQNDPHIVPHMDSLLEFAESRLTMLTATKSAPQPWHFHKSAPPSPPRRSRGTIMHVAAISNSCLACNQDHSIYQCTQFKGWTRTRGKDW